MDINDNNIQNENEWAEEFTWCKCGDVFLSNGGIIGHIAWERREIEGITDLNCPYCNGEFSSSETLKKHIYSKSRGQLETNSETTEWKLFWKDMCGGGIKQITTLLRNRIRPILF